MRKYDSYKDSGVQWLGVIPTHWKIQKMKYSFTERSEKNHPDEPVLCATQSQGVIPQYMYENRVVVVNKGFENLKLVKVGDFVISLRSFQGGIEYAYYQGIISAAYTILKPNDSITPGYARLLMKSFGFIQLLQTCVTGIREGQNINYDLLKNKFSPLPPKEEQEEITKFLDKRTEEIDEQISKVEREIELLKEYKQTEVARVVIHGLNPNAPTKPSGISWIGDIPKHWKVKTLRNYLRMVSEKGHPDEQLLSVVREQGIIIRDRDSQEENHNFIPDDLSGYKLVKVGQFAINKMKAWQGSYGVSSYQGLVSPAYYVCELNASNKQFFNEAIRSKVYVPFFTQYSKGIRVGQWDLSPIGLKSIPFIEPPLSEQQQIVDYIDRKTTSIDRLVVELTYQAEYLKEYKQRLIADVVTGKINVQPD